MAVWPKIDEKFRPAVLGGRLLKVTGRLEREGMVVHLIADHIEDRSRDLSLLGHPSDNVLGQMAPKTDDVPVHLKSDARKTRAMHPREQAKRLFPSRDFH
ncbi:hypothetical protein [Roseibium sp. Sym1]|uniref:hypothetical protein n=1 Tax=Roseibium sp. Sym1 TaxID=3016006 RepID=UPI0022B3689F|nr:hypothetical protein [Roseibium sp. Sym1]